MGKHLAKKQGVLYNIERILVKRIWKGASMLERFYPDIYVSSAYHIDFQKFFASGYRGIIFDIDNPGSPRGTCQPSKHCLYPPIKRDGVRRSLFV